MIDKTLTEGSWKTFAKKKEFKDAALIKALVKLGAADEGSEQRLEALHELETQADVLRKANKADKELAKYLDDLAKALDKERRATEQARKAAQAVAAASEEESGPAVLTTRMIPLLRAIPKGDPAFARIAVVGKLAAVLVSRKTITTASNRLLTDLLQTHSGVKFHDAECLFEANAHTFVMVQRPAGAAKLIKKALFDQTGLRLKVRVRSEDPADIEEDGGEGEEAEAEEPGETAATTAASTATAASAAPSASAAGAAPEPAAALADIKTRLQAAVAALRVARERGAPDADALRQTLAAAGAAAQHQDFATALDLLAQAEPALAAATSATATAQPPGATRGSLVAMQQARLSWDGLRKSVQSQLQSLEQQLLADVRAHNADEAAEDQLDEGEVTAAVRDLYQLLDLLDERLIDKLDDALNAEGERRAALQAEAAGLVREYQRLVDTDPRIAEIDGNGFFPTSIRADARRTLGALLQQL